MFSNKEIKIFLLLFFLLIRGLGYSQNTLDNLGLTSANQATVAFSLRKLSSSYTGSAMKVRNSLGNAIDIGFIGNNLDETSLLAFVNLGDGNGFVDTWYDQSGNGNNAIETTLSFQPKIVNSGTIVKMNSRPSLLASSSRMIISSLSSLTPGLINVVGQSIGTTGAYETFLKQGGPNLWFRLQPTTGNFDVGQNGGQSLYSTTTGGSSTLGIYSAVFSAGTMFKNGVSFATGTSFTPLTTSGSVALFSSPGGSESLSGTVSEFIIFPTVPNRVTLESNQGSYYSIVVPPSNLTYTGSPFTYTKGTAITAVAAPTNTGGAVVSYAVSPGLPTGLALNTTTGAITGTPTVVTASATYTITATNTGGNTSTTISITINDIPPSALTYIGSPFIFGKGTSITPIAAPTNSGGAATSYAVSPALPTGLSLNTATGAITGTPTTITTASNYVVTASNAGGNTTASLNIEVGAFVLDKLGYTASDPKATVAFSLRKLSSSYTGSAIKVRNSLGNTLDIGFIGNNLDETSLLAFVNLGDGNGFVDTWYDQSGNGNNAVESITTLQPKIVNSGAIVKMNSKFGILVSSSRLLISSISITPGLINVVGQSSGTTGLYETFLKQGGPNLWFRLQPTTGNFDVGQNGGQSLSSSTTGGSSSLGIYSAVFSAGTMFKNGVSFATGTSFTPLATTGNVALFSSPGGSESLSGTVSEFIIFPTVPNRIRLESNQGSYYSIVVPPSNLTYTGSPFTFVKGTNITANTIPNYTGGPVVSYSVSPSLPSGLTMNTTTGEITGTPTTIMSASNFLITATNNLGTTTATISISVKEFALDKVGFSSANTKAIAAYSLRKLSSDYTGAAIQVTKDNSTFQDIGFDVSGKLDQTSLTTYAAGGSVYVSTWYDQSGNGKDAVQTINSGQPLIVESGVINVFNTKPSISFTSTSQYFMGPIVTAQTVSFVRNLTGVDYRTIFAQPANGDSSIRMSGGGSFKYGDGNTSDWWYPTTPWLNSQETDVPATNFHTGVFTRSSPVTSDFSISSTFNSRGLYSGNKLPELIVFSSTLTTSERQTLENNQASYYNLLPLVSYSSPSAYTKGVAIATISPSSTGAAVVSYSISPPLPSGLILNTTTGEITGTPSQATATTTYTITASNGFSSTATISITVNKANTTITATGATTYTYTGTAQGPSTATVTGSTGAITYSYAGIGATTYGPSATAPIGAGTYEVVATVVADTNYNAASSSALGFTIAKANTTITATGATTYTYTGTAQGPSTATVTGSTATPSYSNTRKLYTT
jgi:hypothetical protein